MVVSGNSEVGLFQNKSARGWRNHRSTSMDLAVAKTKAPSLFPDEEYPIVATTGDRLDCYSATST
jgi:hypothetical protein